VAAVMPANASDRTQSLLEALGRLEGTVMTGGFSYNQADGASSAHLTFERRKYWIAPASQGLPGRVTGVQAQREYRKNQQPF